MYTVALLILASSLLFLWSHNPVHGVLTLVGTGLGFAAYLLNAGLEFTAFIVVLVYVGAVTVLFIFVVMMVNLRATSNSFVLVESIPVWLLLVFGLGLTSRWDFDLFRLAGPTVDVGNQTNLLDLGGLIWGTERVVLIFFVAAVLFIAMVAAICLSLVSSENYRTQDFYTQIRRTNALFGFKR